MSISQVPPILSELATGAPIPLEKRAYFHARVMNNFYQFILLKFLEEEKAGRLTKAELARRIERRPEVISRLLGAPGNWGLDTATDLLLGISGEELMPASCPLLGRAPRNYRHADWLVSSEPSTGSKSANLNLGYWANEGGPVHGGAVKLDLQKETSAGSKPKQTVTVENAAL